MTPPALGLSFQIAYRCRHSGACCTSGWPIPIEEALAIGLKQSAASGELRLDTADDTLAADPLATPAGLPGDVGALARCAASGACAFYERGSGLCAIHRQLGPERLPSSCAHFPRVCLIDEDATYVTLSHYCPTVAGLIFDRSTVEGRASRVEGGDGPRPAVVPAQALIEGLRVEGLDARGQLPPLLRPGMLADRASYRAWERFLVEELAGGLGTAEARLARVAELTDRVCGWTPSMGPSLEGYVDRCVKEHRDGHPDRQRPGLQKRQRRATGGKLESGLNFGLDEAVRDCCPPALAPPAAPDDLDALLQRWVDPKWDKWSGAVGGYLAAKVFGSWLAYQGRGLRTVVEGVFAALAVLRVEAARQCAANDRPLDAALLKEALREADRIIVHLASREQMARRLDDLVVS